MLAFVGAGNGKIHPFGDIYGMIADAFKIFGYHKVIDAKLAVGMTGAY